MIQHTANRRRKTMAKFNTTDPAVKAGNGGSTEESEPAKRVVLYVRTNVTQHGDDQLQELRDHASSEGYQVVEEAIDDGYSSDDPNRPGLTRVMNLAQAGAIDLVIAKRRDRFFRSRLYRLVWDRNLEDLGVQIVSLRESGNRFGDALQDQFAEWEREETVRYIAGQLRRRPELIYPVRELIQRSDLTVAARGGSA